MAPSSGTRRQSGWSRKPSSAPPDDPYPSPDFTTPPPGIRRQIPRCRIDILSAAQRSYCMSQIRGRDTKPELALRKAVFRLGLRYRVTNRMPGRPDMIFPRERVAVFVDGCFWHRCPEHGVAPRSNADFWERKLRRNVERDAEVAALLEQKGWTLLRYWEHQVRSDLLTIAARVCQAVFLSRANLYGSPASSRKASRTMASDVRSGVKPASSRR
jgi:DNA mismatch endonuclease, patch repair protein